MQSPGGEFHMTLCVLAPVNLLLCGNGQGKKSPVQLTNQPVARNRLL